MAAVTNTIPSTDAAITSDFSNLPAAKANAYIAIFEDALEQLQVLSDILPEQMKTDNKAV